MVRNSCLIKTIQMSQTNRIPYFVQILNYHARKYKKYLHDVINNQICIYLLSSPEWFTGFYLCTKSPWVWDKPMINVHRPYLIFVRGWLVANIYRQHSICRTPNSLMTPLTSICIGFQLFVLGVIPLVMCTKRCIHTAYGAISLLWRQMVVIASQITSLAIAYSTIYSDVDQRKHQSSASLAFMRGIHRWPVNSQHKWPITRKMFPFDDLFMICCFMCAWVCDVTPTKQSAANCMHIHRTYCAAFGR